MLEGKKGNYSIINSFSAKIVLKCVITRYKNISNGTQTERRCMSYVIRQQSNDRNNK